MMAEIQNANYNFIDLLIVKGIIDIKNMHSATNVIFLWCIAIKMINKLWSLVLFLHVSEMYITLLNH